MCIQECALYGGLVLWLRDRAAELFAGERGDREQARTRLDGLIHDWFFTTQDELYGCAPRDLIWAEQMGKPNPIHPERVAEFFEDDCPVCQFERDSLAAELAAGEDPSFHWHYDDGGCPLISLYDPEGWDARWAEEEAGFEADHHAPEAPDLPAAADYQPLPADSRQVDPETFLRILQRPGIDPPLHQAAKKIIAHCDVPIPDARGGMQYRRIVLAEALSVLSGLDRQGVDVDALLAQIDAWPYENVALDWLSEPEQNVVMLCRALDQQTSGQGADEMLRLRQHRDFILTLAQVVPPAARLWLQGWLEAVAHGAFTRGDTAGT